MDGVPISTLRTSFLRQQIAMVSQDPMLSTGTVLDNVATGLTGTPYERLLDGSNDAEVRRLCQSALEKAQAWDFVSRLPDGIDSVVSGARTGVLSGGQRQRLAVARAL
jgi:ATP-binding cassette subfamily B (MDR/TAP) protein 1